MNADMFENALPENDSENTETVKTEIYKRTEELIYNEINALEKANDAMRVKPEMVKQLEEMLGIKDNLPEMRGLSHADVIHVAVLTLRLIFRLTPESSIDAETIMNIVAMMCRDDGIDFNLR